MTTPETISKQMHDALLALEHANERCYRAEMQFKQARCEHIDATNEVNNAQKTVDELVIGIKKTAPYGTDWKHDRSSGHAV